MLCRSGEEAGICQHCMISSLLTAKSHVFGISEIHDVFPKTIYEMEIMIVLFQFKVFGNTLFHNGKLFVLHQQLCIEVRVTCHSCRPVPVPAEKYR